MKTSGYSDTYIDGFVFPVARTHLDAYRKVAEQVALVWKEYGALSYCEYVGDDLHLAGTKSFASLVNPKVDEVVIFGYVVFPNKSVRDAANRQVPADPRMETLVGPLVDPDRLIFDAGRMVYGGFEALVNE